MSIPTIEQIDFFRADWDAMPAKMVGFGWYVINFFELNGTTLASQMMGIRDPDLQELVLKNWVNSKKRETMD